VVPPLLPRKGSLMTQLVREKNTGLPLLLDFHSCPVWRIPLSSFYRIKALVRCGLKTRHAVYEGNYFYYGDGGSWWSQCKCGYFGTKDKD
jgi:hypothetical protein